MIIDSHTHIFPDKVAAKALPKLSSVIHLEPSMDGTIHGLKASMEKAGIDLSVVLPTITDVHQFDSILRFAVHVNETCAEGPGPRLISLGAVHPADAQYKEQLRQVKQEGFKGIKLHPNYQGLNFDDIRNMRLIYAASELDLFIVTHTGVDPYTPDQLYCDPDMILHVLKEVAPPKLVLAHMGCNEHYPDSEEKLCGQNVYLDTSYSLMNMPEEQLIRMIHKHGAGKILFGTDAPWTTQKDCVEKINSLTALSPEEKEQILYRNTAKLLGMI